MGGCHFCTSHRVEAPLRCGKLNVRILAAANAKSHPEQQPIVTFAACAKLGSKAGPMLCAPVALQLW
jgi:hypothetical protein